MASETPSVKRTGWRIARWLLALFSLTILLLIFLAGWLTTTESGTRVTFNLLRTASSGMFAADDVQGRLLGSLHIGKLTIRQPDSDLHITQLQLEWQPDALQDGVLHIHLLRATSVLFALHSQSAKPPAKWQSPLQLRLDNIEVAHMQIAQDAQPLLSLTTLQGNLQFDGQHIRQAALNINAIELAQLQRNWPASRFSLQAQLDSEGRGKLSLQNQAAGRIDQARLPLRKATARFQLTDDTLLLSDLQIDAGPGAQMQGHASVRANALTVMLDTQALNLHALDARLRATHLSGRANLSRNAAQNQITQFSLSLAEPWQHAPIRLTAQASLNDTRLTVATARLEHGVARAELSGMLDFSSNRKFSAQGSFHQLHPKTSRSFLTARPYC
jgi:autotransporter translocation and assembly factor TamB